jgi:hypothetical protein
MRSAKWIKPMAVEGRVGGSNIIFRPGRLKRRAVRVLTRRLLTLGYDQSDCIRVTVEEPFTTSGKDFQSLGRGVE